MIHSDIDRLVAMVNSPERPIQLIFSGKAHPADEPGKQLIQRIANLRHDPRFAGRIAFVEDYDINVCRHLIQGVDVWLNNPRRPQEASGTSGQKAVLNGALNLSVLDGWWAEAYDGENGWGIDGTPEPDEGAKDARDAKAFYDLLEREVIPLFHDRDEHGVPVGWVRRIKRSLRTVGPRFCADRMLAQYVNEVYRG
jgi:starch phosphorylase